MEVEELNQFLTLIPTLHIDKMVKLFVKTRAAKAAAKKVFDTQESEFNAIMQACENNMLKKADADGVTGFTTPFGTTYTAETTKISIADDASFFDFVKAQADLDFFERRVSTTHVANYAKLHDGAMPPGLNVFRERVMRVRKAGDK